MKRIAQEIARRNRDSYSQHACTARAIAASERGTVDEPAWIAGEVKLAAIAREAPSIPTPRDKQTELPL